MKFDFLHDILEFFFENSVIVLGNLSKFPKFFVIAHCSSSSFQYSPFFDHCSSNFLHLSLFRALGEGWLSAWVGVGQTSPNPFRLIGRTELERGTALSSEQLGLQGSVDRNACPPFLWEIGHISSSALPSCSSIGCHENASKDLS